MTKVRDILNFLAGAAPLELQLDFDNSGFLLGRSDAEVRRVLLSLDVTGEVVEEAVSEQAQLIVSHHPVIFRPIKAITDEKLLSLLENSIAVISMHTNLDIAAGGVNDVLLRLLGASGNEALDDDGCGRIGVLDEELELRDFLAICREKLDCKGLRYWDAGRRVKKLAVMGGAGGDFVEQAFQRGCDTYVTSDIKYNRFLEAAEMGINLIDADHFCTENPVIPVLAEKLSAAFPEVEFIVSRRHRQLIDFA